MKTILNRFVAFLSLLLLPTLANACGGGAFYLSDGDLALLGSILLGIFLAGYLPYVIFSVKLSRQAATAEGTKKSTKIWASIFALINTVVFIAGLPVVMENPLITLGDLLLWGTPFYFYIKGMRGTTASSSSSSTPNADLLDS